MATLQFLADQVLGNPFSTPGFDVVLNDGGLRLQETTAAPLVTIIGTTNNVLVATDGDEIIQVNEPIRLLRPESIDRLLNNSSDGRPSELRLMVEAAFIGGSVNLQVVTTSKTVVTLEKEVSTTDTEIAVSTPFSNNFQALPIEGMPVPVWGAAAAHVGDFLFIFGGINAAGASVDTIQVYSHGEAVWYTHSATMGTGVAHSAVTQVDAGASVTVKLVGGSTYAVGVETITDYSETYTITKTAVAGLPPVISAQVAVALSADRSRAAIVEDTGFDAHAVATIEIDDPVAIVDDATLVLTDALGTIVTFEFDDDGSGASSPGNIVIDSSSAVAITIADLLRTAIEANLDISADAAGAASIVLTQDTGGTAGNSTTTGTAVGSGLTLTADFAGGLDDSGAIYVIGGETAVGVKTAVIHTVIMATGVLTALTGEDAAPIVLATAAAGVGAFLDVAVAGEERIVIVGGDTGSAILSSVQAIPVPNGVTVGPISTLTVTLNTARAYMGVSRAEDSDIQWLIGGVGDIVAFPNKTLLTTFESIDLLNSTDVFFQHIETLTRAVAHSAIPMFAPKELPNRKLEFTGGVLNDAAGVAFAKPVDVSELLIFNFGLGNLESTTVGFPTIDGVIITDYEIQIDHEILLVTSTNIERGLDGKEYDSMLVTRARKTSTAIVHKIHSDVYEGQDTLYQQLLDTYAALLGSDMDQVIVPSRAYADSPFLPKGTNFAFALAFFCWVKSRETGLTLGFIGTKPAWENPFVLPTQASITTWVDALTAFDRVNFDSELIWDIGNGRDDNDSDQIPDTYAFWATSTGDIPVGSPPASDGRIVVDLKDNPVDLGSFISLVTWDGNGFNNIVRDKYGPITGNLYQVVGHIQYSGMVSALAPQIGATNKVIAGVAATRKLSGIQVGDLDTARYVTAQVKDDGYKISTGWTFAHRISDEIRSDFVFLSTIRVAKAAIDQVLRVAERFIGQPTGATRQAMEADIREALKDMVPDALRSFDFSVTATPGQIILGRETITLTLVPQFERRNILVVASLDRPFVQ